MYKDFYGLREKPFNKTPDPRFLYLSKAHEEAFARLQYVVEEKEIILFTGEIGCGKTTLTRALMDSLNESYRVILILNPRLTANQFLRTIARRLEVNPPFNHKDDLLDAIYQKVYEDYENGITPVIIIDEAQLIPKKETFEEIRLLTNFQLDNTNLISLIFVAQPDILRRLKHKVYAPLRQRIGIFYHLPPLSEEEVSEYIKFRLKISGREAPLFTDKAIALIHRHSMGIPRIINSIATSALLDAFSKDSQLIDNTNVMDAVEELGL
ncbi:Type II secretory pathway, component ExeA (predicted ATPase) [hydrothermal vent metagenome]|uniref:Type II secretory pathway, component ExeA (Predicted ATPase) n=1 Tax=hydrothermal vent metagenome TaxID=652676 RepID=A0A3B1CS46_9ZZZZ